MSKKYTHTIINKHGDVETIIKEKEEKKKHSSFLSIDIGMYLIIPLLAGIAIGIYLDNKLNKKPLFTLIFIFLGTIVTFYNLYKIIKDVSSTSRNNK